MSGIRSYITGDNSDSRIKIHTVGETTAFSWNFTTTTTYPHSAIKISSSEFVWSDLPEIIRPREIISLPYTSYSDSPTKSGLAVFYNQWGSEKGIISAGSYAGGEPGNEIASVQFEPRYMVPLVTQLSNLY